MIHTGSKHVRRSRIIKSARGAAGLLKRNYVMLRLSGSEGEAWYIEEVVSLGENAGGVRLHRLDTGVADELINRKLVREVTPGIMAWADQYALGMADARRMRGMSADAINDALLYWQHRSWRHFEYWLGVCAALYPSKNKAMAA